MLITQPVYAAVEDDVEVSALGERSVAGFRRPVDVFAVERARPQAQAVAGGPSTLSLREREVAVLVARGLTNRQIAEELVISGA